MVSDAIPAKNLPVPVTAERQAVADVLNKHGYQAMTVFRLVGFVVVWCAVGEDQVWEHMPPATVHRVIRELRAAGVNIRECSIGYPSGIRGSLARFYWKNMGTQVAAALEARREKMEKRKGNKGKAATARWSS